MAPENEEVKTEETTEVVNENIEPKEGDPCLTEGQNLPGKLGKDEVGNWVCIPD